MKNLVFKMMNIIFIVVVTMVMMSSFVNAANEKTALNVIILNADGEKIIYIEGLNSTEFKYAFSDKENDTEAIFQTNKKDANGENIALGESSEKEYLLVTTDGKDVKSVKLSDVKTISKEEIEEIEKLTTNIKVKTDETQSTSTKDGDTTVTTTVGKIVIDDENKENYKYQAYVVEVKDLNKSSKELDEKAVELYSKLTELESANTMFEKLSTEITIRDDYETLLKSAKWENVENYSVLEPEEAVNEEKYAVLIQKLENNEVVDQDIQFMTTSRSDAKGVEEETSKEEKQVPVKTILPKTGEQIAIYIALGLIGIAIIAVIIRMFILKGKNYGKH